MTGRLGSLFSVYTMVFVALETSSFYSLWWVICARPNAIITNPPARFCQPLVHWSLRHTFSLEFRPSICSSISWWAQNSAGNIFFFLFIFVIKHTATRLEQNFTDSYLNNLLTGLTLAAVAGTGFNSAVSGIGVTWRLNETCSLCLYLGSPMSSSSCVCFWCRLCCSPRMKTTCSGRQFRSWCLSLYTYISWAWVLECT